MEDDKPPLHICALCGKHCPSEGCVTNAEGRAVHKDCYRLAIIEGRDVL
jgi:hypothetical protein